MKSPWALGLFVFSQFPPLAWAESNVAFMNKMMYEFDLNPAEIKCTVQR